jgi:voltage-gated potassium channel Kch
MAREAHRMTLLAQIAVGGALFLGACLIHLLAMAVVLGLVRRAEDVTWFSASAMFLFLAASHVTQIALWAVVLTLSQALPDFEEALYFALTTYTTVGYGDVTLEGDARLFGTMAAFAGILTFGLRTALLVTVFGRVLDHE